MERKFLFSSFLGLFQPTLAWNEAIIVFFKFLNFFPIFLKFSTTRRVGTKQNGNFYFPLSKHSPTYFGLKWILDDILLFLKFFCYFLGIFYYASGRNEMERKFLFSQFLGLFQLTLAWNEGIMEYFNFLDFFAIFYNASCRNEMERKFLFSSFLGLFQLTFAWNEAIIVFFNFLNFLPIFLKFSTTRRVGTKQNGNIYFPSF